MEKFKYVPICHGDKTIVGHIIEFISKDTLSTNIPEQLVSDKTQGRKILVNIQTHYCKIVEDKTDEIPDGDLFGYYDSKGMLNIKLKNADLNYLMGVELYDCILIEFMDLA